jgi:hypothetical protein
MAETVVKKQIDRRFIQAILGVLAVGFVLMSLGNVLRLLADTGRYPIDFEVYYLAAKRIAVGENPYFGGDILERRYIYPQFLAICFSPVADWTIQEVYRVWLPLNWLMHFATIVLVLVYSAKMLKSDQFSSKKRWMLYGFFAVIAMGFSPAFYGLRLGQLDILITFLLAVFLVFPGRWQGLLGGLLVGLTIVLKVSPVLLVPVFVLAFGWRFLATLPVPVVVYGAMIASMGLVSQELILFREQIPYWQYKTEFPTISLYYIVSVRMFPDTFIQGDYYASWLTQLMKVLFLGGYAVTGLYVWWRKGHWLSLLTVGILFSHLASPFLEPHHYTITLLVLIPWSLFALQQRDSPGIAICCVAWFGFLYFLIAYEMYYRPEDWLILGEIALLYFPLKYADLGGSSVQTEELQNSLLGSTPPSASA